MLAAFAKGFFYFIKGFSLIRQPGIRRFVYVPLLINILLFSALIYYSWQQITVIMQAVQNMLPAWLVWLQGVLWVSFLAVILIAVFLTFTLIANLIGAPFNSLLAEGVEKRLTGQQIPIMSWRQIGLDLLPMAWREIKKLFYYLFWVVSLTILTFIPPLTLIAPVLWFGFSAWMLALQYIDYPMANHWIKPAHQRRLLAKKRMIALGFGSGALLTMMVPVVNFLVMPVAVAGATCLWINEFKNVD